VLIDSDSIMFETYRTWLFLTGVWSLSGAWTLQNQLWWENTIP